MVSYVIVWAQRPIPRSLKINIALKELPLRNHPGVFEKKTLRPSYKKIKNNNLLKNNWDIIQVSVLLKHPL